MTIGGTAAWWVAVALGARLPIFAALVPLVAMTGDPFAAVSVSLGRILGVFAGVAIGVACVHLPLGLTVRVAIALLLGTFVAVAVQIGGRPNLEVPIAALFLIGFPGAHTEQLGVQRIWETAIGAVVAIVVSALLWPPDPVRQLTHDLDRLRQELVDDLTAIAEDIATGSGETSAFLDEVRAHSLDAVRDVFEIDAARRALRWNPRSRHDAEEVDELARRIRLAARIYRHTRSFARDVADEPLRDERLAQATRHLADATDRALRGDRPHVPLERAGGSLGGGTLLAHQLRQLHTDIAAATTGYGSSDAET
ncbi:MAG TPA: FUSC family protein [Gaiellaceae bacterium]